MIKMNREKLIEQLVLQQKRFFVAENNKEIGFLAFIRKVFPHTPRSTNKKKKGFWVLNMTSCRTVWAYFGRCEFQF